MTFNLSTNIKTTKFSDINYIVTQNAAKTAGSLINDYVSGIHSFTLIGSYGTGKSSFLLALENDMLNGCTELFVNNGQFNGFKKFVHLNIVGEYDTLPNLFCRELNLQPTSTEDLFDAFDKKLKNHRKKKEFLIIAIDEFGKILEHAAKVNPEKEIYFLQQLSEFINNPKQDNVILLATLHQNMNAYASALSIEQKQEWDKVKGRFKEIVFSEPEEQLLSVAAMQIGRNGKHIENLDGFHQIFKIAKKAYFVASDTLLDVARKIYPMDILAGVVVTRAIQRYGQNERSLFSFLTAVGEGSVSSFKAQCNSLFNLANVFDYISYSFYSYLSEVNSDSTNWRAAKNAIERVEGLFPTAKVVKCVKLVKAVSLMNIFCPAIKMDKDLLSQYAELAMDTPKADSLLDELCTQNILRFAKYKNQYIIFEGSDINIEDEMFRAAGQVAIPTDYIEALSPFIERRVVLANAVYYKTGTPRYFQYEISDHALEFEPKGDVDGYINIIFSLDKKEEKQVIEASRKCKKAIIYVYYNKTKELVDHLYEIAKLEHVKKNIVNDKVAEREISNLISYEKDEINSCINDGLFSYSDTIKWYFKGCRRTIASQSDFNKLLSSVCEDVYPYTPIIRNELFNRHKVANSAVSLARVALHNALINPEAVEQEDLGFPQDKFPPEKTVYYTLLKETGIHEKRNGIWSLGNPSTESVSHLWECCENFLQSTIDKKRKLSELIKILQAAPFKLKQGFIEMWLPIYLIVKKQEYSLYSDSDAYIPSINREVLDLLQKNPNNFRIKAFAINGVKLDFFNQYRQFLRKDEKNDITENSFVETIKPFLAFYRSLNGYARTTLSFDNPDTVKFRDVLANATDPEKTFFEDMPAALGFVNESLASNAEFMEQYQMKIKRATHELVTCYPKLIDSIESNLISILGLHSKDYLIYKSEIEKRFKLVKEDFLSIKQKSFLKGLLRKETDKIRWYESICYVALDKPLSTIKDYELTQLTDNLKFLIRTLDKFVDISRIAKTKIDSDIFNFELVSTTGTIKAQSFVLPDSQKATMDDLEKKISSLLTGDNNVDVCTLLKILQSKIEQ